MKPTIKQIKIIDTIVSIVSSWKNSNDINSPSLETYIEETIFTELEDSITDVEQCELNQILEDMLWLVRDFQD